MFTIMGLFALSSWRLWMRLALPYRSRIAIPYKVQLHYSRRGSMHHYTLELGIHKGKFYSPYHGTLVPHIQRTLVVPLLATVR